MTWAGVPATGILAQDSSGIITSLALVIWSETAHFSCLSLLDFKKLLAKSHFHSFI